MQRPRSGPASEQKSTSVKGRPASALAVARSRTRTGKGSDDGGLACLVRRDACGQASGKAVGKKRTSSHGIKESSCLGEVRSGSADYRQIIGRFTSAIMSINYGCGGEIHVEVPEVVWSSAALDAVAAGTAAGRHAHVCSGARGADRGRAEFSCGILVRTTRKTNRSEW